MDAFLTSVWAIYQRISPLFTVALFILLATRFNNSVLKVLCWLLGLGLGIAFIVRLVLGLQ